LGGARNLTSTVPTVAGLITARIDSSRLPGKALRFVADTPLIGYVMERAARIPGLCALVLATTLRPIDQELAAYAARHGLAVWRGDTADVAARLLYCCEQLGADYFVRLNGDTPFLDPDLIAVGLNHVSCDYDLITNIPGRTYPYGISVEIVRRQALEEAHPLMTEDDREHVTQYMYMHPHQFRMSAMESDAPELATARLAVDTEDDLRAFAAVVEQLGSDTLTADFKTVAALYIDMGHVLSRPRLGQPEVGGVA